MSGELPVKAQCLPFAQIPHTTRLFTDYLAYAPAVRPFYPRSPQFAEWVAQENPAERYDVGRRARVADALERQNRLWGTSEKTLDNIATLRSGAAAVLTGQQVGLFGGPMFAIYKALTAVKLAEQARAAGVEAVPIFWLATNDHDLAEVNHVSLAGLDGQRKEFSTPSHGLPSAPVGTIRMGEEIIPVVHDALELLGDSEVSAFLSESYRPGETLGSAFAKIYAKLFAHWGVVLLDPCQPDLQSIAAPIYAAAIERAEELDAALLARGRDLESAGYHQQAKVTASSTLLFTMKDGARVPIHRRMNGNGAGGFVIGEDKIGQDELLRRIHEAPHNFTPNVLLRPILQDYLLPTLAYTGGSAEVAYFAQVGVVYETLLGHVTPVVPRFSATLVEPKEERLLAKYKIGVIDVLQGPEVLEKTLARRTLPAELDAAFQHATETLGTSLASLRKALSALDPTLVEALAGAESKMSYHLSRLQGQAARAQLQKSEVLIRHATQLSGALFPEKALQERQVGGLSFLARHGLELLQNLYGVIHTDCHDHQVVTLE
jgi:bacillithiol biosynthesis cysteine-adding enzyme BshC